MPSISQVAAELGVSPSQVHSALKRHNIKRRPRNGADRHPVLDDPAALAALYHGDGTPAKRKVKR